MARETVLTPEGYEKLTSEIEHLRTEKRREVAERIKEAREFGDISENAEYDHAKNEQAMLEARIAQLEDKLRNATVIDQKQLDAGVVSVGTSVRVKDQKSGQSMLFHIVGSAEADPSESKLSNESPVGQRPDRPQAGRHRHRAGSARPQQKAEDHQDRNRLKGRGGRSTALPHGRPQR